MRTLKSSRNTKNPDVRESMRLAGITQKELAAYLGIAAATLNRLMKYTLATDERLEIIDTLNFLLDQKEKDLKSARALINPDQ